MSTLRAVGLNGRREQGFSRRMGLRRVARLPRILRLLSLAACVVGATVLTTTDSNAATDLQPALRVGILATVTEDGIDINPGVVSGIEARVAAQNRAGGVDGRRLVVVKSLDDQGSPSANAQDQTELVEQYHVNVVLMVSYGFTSATTLQKSKTLYIGFGVTPGFCNNQSTYGFSFIGCGNSSVYGGTENVSQVAQIIPKGAPHTVAILGENVAATVAGDATEGSEFSRAGWRVCANSSSVPPTTTDASPYVQQVINSCAGNPPTVILNDANATPIAITAAEKALGYKGTIVNFTVYVPAYVKAPQTASTLEGTYNNTYGFGTPETNPKAYQALLSQLKKVGANYDGLSTSQGWAAADQYIKMLQKYGPKSSDSQIAAKLNGGGSLPGSPGIYPPSKWPSYRNAPAPCASTVKVQNSKWVSVLPLGCYSTFKISK
jgi:ABC-type branched-subunit amino acid transport system substrate-binding protein